MRPLRSMNQTSGSTIQNSARCRVVFEFSARNVGPKVYTAPNPAAYVPHAPRPGRQGPEGHPEGGGGGG